MENSKAAKVSTDLTQDLTHDAIQSVLRTERYGRTIVYKDCTESTNTDAASLIAQDATCGTTVVADHQTAGRGSRGRSWKSPPGTDLYFSIIENRIVDAVAMASLALAVGVGVAKCIETLTEGQSRCKVKWPNDVLLSGKKCAGVLIETTQRGNAHPGGFVIGVGVNVNRRMQTPDPSVHHEYPATSIRDETQTRWNRAYVLGQMLNHIEEAMDAHLKSRGLDTIRELKRRLAFIGDSVDCGGIQGRLVGVDASGFAEVERQSEIIRVLSGPLRPMAHE